ncbi:MAG: ImmA/IrrE family metallo-endopeptidase, partial [Sulfurimonas sp.]|nr:ImmA/IrrE family metallo-endopeptidase [Sulfurimonas sp.]
GDYNQKEFEADNFAASLLMPKEISIKVWKKTRDIDDFADAMQVSKVAASIRLRNLGLIY